MADRKISELTNITGANLADDDEFALVDTSADETKAITFGEFKTALDTATGFVRITGDTMTGNLSMGDNVKAIFGAGSDLQIYHDGSNNSSYIKETGAGSFNIEATNLFLKREGGTENFIDCVTNGAVTAYYDGSPKLATTSTGVDITGTLTSDDISIADSSPTLLFNRTDRATDNKIIRFAHDGEDFQLQLANDAVSSVTPAIAINRTGMTLDSIAFYEDTGTTPKFFWDASAESLGIGTTSPSQKLTISGGTSDVAMLWNSTDTAYYNFGILKNGSLIQMGEYNNAGDTLAESILNIEMNGNKVGIGTSSPQADLMIGNADGASRSIVIHTMNNGNARLRFREGSTVTSGYNEYSIGMDGGDNAITFETQGNGEVMRIDGGNLLVGKTSADFGSSIGFEANSNDTVYATRSGGASLTLNRTTSDGDIALFRKDGTTVGSIGAYTSGANNYLTVGNADTGIIFNAVNDAVHPWNITSNAGRDAAIDLGRSSQRFKDLYLSGGVYLGGTGSANLLDDYEYGFFEPEFGGDVSDPTVTYDGTVGNEGWYVKVGRLVFIQINMRTDSVSGGSGAVVIRNLPFVTPNLSGQGGMSSFTIGYADNWAGERPIAGTIAEGVTYINLSHRSAVDGNNITTNITDLGTGANANLIRLSGTYYTTA